LLWLVDICLLLLSTTIYYYYTYYLRVANELLSITTRVFDRCEPFKRTGLIL